MATGGEEQGHDIVPDYDECPVCRDCLKDPRMLNCSHYFCRVCIEGLVRENPQGPIKCPTCREVTQVPEGSGVTDLPRHEGKYTFSDQVTDFLSRAERQATTSCDICRDKKVNATGFCFRCRKSMCAQCLNKHKNNLPGHKYVPMSEHIFCGTHSHEVVVDNCTDCKRGVCVLCVFDEHAGHQKVDIEHVAEEGRLRLQEYLKIQSEFDKDDRTLRNIQFHIERAKNVEEEFKELISETRKLIKELEAKLDEVERETKAKFASEKKTLSLYETDIKDFISSRKSLVNHATYLTDKASDPELIEQEKFFPVNKVRSVQNIDNASIELPVISSKFKGICSQLQQIVLACEMDLNKRKIEMKDMDEIKKKHTISVGHKMGGITMDLRGQRLIARTDDASGPLKVYDYQGQLQESLGAGVNGMADGSECRGICMDTKREQILAPCQGTLVLVNRAGQQVKSITIGSNNKGVAYHKAGDCYLVSDCDKQTVYLIDPDTSQVTRQIGSPGSGPTQFKGPYNIHVGTVAGVANECILVSDRYNNCIKLFDIFGHHVKTYGSKGSGDSQLDCPLGVITDRQGQVIVCDQCNFRVVSFSTNNTGKEEWKRVLNRDWKSPYPLYIALDTYQMVMAIVDGSTNTLHIYY